MLGQSWRAGLVLLIGSGLTALGPAPVHASGFLLIQTPKAAPPLQAGVPPVEAPAPTTLPSSPVTPSLSAPIPEAATGRPKPEKPVKAVDLYPSAQVDALPFSALPGWNEDDQAASLKALLLSCTAMVKAAGAPRTQPRVWSAIRNLCPLAEVVPKGDRLAARQFFERHFLPFRFSAKGEADGFLTGYYEPEVLAARRPDSQFATPFLQKPHDLVSANAGGGFDARSSAGFLFSGTMLPYFDRAEIESGALSGRNLEIAWAKDPADVLFTQIQGSARLKLIDGGTLRIGYAAHNGHRYTPVGRVMVERNIAPREKITMDFIRAWMLENPGDAPELRQKNRSYVFFRPLDLSADEGPIGAQGVPVTGWRSLAVDRGVHAYGTPIFIAGPMPTGDHGEELPFQRLLIAQDTGSAIQGQARGDIFYGTGLEAGSMAGRTKHRALWFVLLPASLVGEAQP